MRRYGTRCGSPPRRLRHADAAGGRTNEPDLLRLWPADLQNEEPSPRAPRLAHGRGELPLPRVPGGPGAAPDRADEGCARAGCAVKYRTFGADPPWPMPETGKTTRGETDSKG